MQWQWGNGKEDRLSALSDDILCSHILTRLTLREAIRCSILCRRWARIWTQLHRLNFSRQFFRSVSSNREAKAIIIKLLIDSAHLDSFELEVDKPDFDYVWELKLCNKISECIALAAAGKVKKITLKNTYAPCSVPINLFSCNCLTSLWLQNFEIASIPTNPGCFPCLTTCFLEAIWLNDGILEQLIAGCPCLKSLTLSGCEGLTDLKISSPVLSYLNIGIGTGINPKNIDQNTQSSLIPNSMTLNCPQLGTLDLETNRLFKRRPELTQFMDALLKMSVEINVPICRRLLTNLPFGNILNSFPSLEDLSMDTYCFQDTVNGNKVSILTMPLEKLKKVHMCISVFGEKDLHLVGCILKNSPLLETMKFFLPFRSKNS
ncbi:hypothetical protein KI387_039641, partial [Taxus chinensis]